MFRGLRHVAIVSPSALLVALLVLACSPAAAQVVKPFKIKGAGVGPNGLPLPLEPARFHWVVGEATHLGRHYGEGYVQTDTADIDLVNGRITGTFGSGDDEPFVFTGANGEQLVCYYGRTDHGATEAGTYELTILDILPTGQLLVQALWIAQFVPVSDECTGKFAGVTGSWVMYARSEPFLLPSTDKVAYSWEGEGFLTFAKPKSGK